MYKVSLIEKVHHLAFTKKELEIVSQLIAHAKWVQDDSPWLPGVDFDAAVKLHKDISEVLK